MRSFNAGKIPNPRLRPELERIFELGPVDVEIGAGQGLHAIIYSRDNPGRQLIAIERTQTRFKQLSRRRADRPDLTNLHPVHADALSIFVHCLPDQSIERIFLLYPNPYPKQKQSNLRWHNMPFMQLIKRKLKTGGSLNLATNLENYAGEAEQKMIADWRFQLSAKRILKRGDSPRTHFEKKYLERGEHCWNLIFVNPGQEKRI